MERNIICPREILYKFSFEKFDVSIGIIADIFSFIICLAKNSCPNPTNFIQRINSY